MTTYEVLSLTISFGCFVLALLSYSRNRKKNKK